MMFAAPARSARRHAAVALTALLLLAGPGTALAQCVDPPVGAVAWWTFDEEFGSTAEDHVGDNDGSHAGVSEAAGQVHAALSFDGGDSVFVPDSSLWAFEDADFTIEMWANFATTGGGSLFSPGDVLIGHDEGFGEGSGSGGCEDCENPRRWIFALGAGVLFFELDGPEFEGGIFAPQVAFTPVIGEWVHLAVTRAGDTFSIYVDGILGGTATQSVEVPDASASLSIGNADGFGFEGLLDEVTIYHQALSAAELLAIAQAGSDGKCREPILVFHSPDDDGVPPDPDFPPGCSAVTGFLASTGAQGAALIDVNPETGVGQEPETINLFGPVTEIEFRADGTLFGGTGANFHNFITIDPESGNEMVVGNHEVGALTGLEFVGDTLYGALKLGEAQTQLVTVDHRGEGALTTVGETGFSDPIGGLAYDLDAATMYAATAGSGASQLFTINLGNGMASPVGVGIGFDDVAALEFGPGGLLYGGLGGQDEFAGELITIDLMSGAGTRVGPSGFAALSGLSQDVSCVLAGGPGETLHLWVDGGSRQSQTGEGGGQKICKKGSDGGSGSELCGAHLLVQLEGPGFFTHFKAEMPTLVHNPDCVGEAADCPLPADTKQIQMNFVRGGVDPQAVVRELGELTVDSTGADLVNRTTLSLTGVAGAGANLQLRPIASSGTVVVAKSQETMAMPEPGAVLSLTSGVLALALLDRHRRRRSRRRR